MSGFFWLRREIKSSSKSDLLWSVSPCSVQRNNSPQNRYSYRNGLPFQKQIMCIVKVCLYSANLMKKNKSINTINIEIMREKREADILALVLFVQFLLYTSILWWRRNITLEAANILFQCHWDDLTVKWRLEMDYGV